KCADEMKITRRFARREDELYGWRVISPSLIQLFQTFKTMAGTREFVTHARQLRFRVADGFMSTNHCINGRFAFSLQLRNACPGISQFECKSFSFEFSFGVLARSSIAFTRETLGLL